MKTRIPCRATLAVLAGLCLVAGGAAPDDPKPDAYEPKARALLEEVAKAYQALDAYEDHGSLRGELVVAKRIGNSVQVGQTQRTTKRSLAFSRPNKLRIQLDNITVYCDGKKVTSVLIPPKKYAEAPVPDRVDTQELVKVAGARAPVALAFAADGALATAVVLDLLVSPDPVKSVLDGTDGLKLEPDRDVNGHNRKSLFVDQTEGPDIRMLVDPETKHIDIIELVYDLKSVNSEQPRERQFQQLTLTWRAGDVSTRVPESAFEFKPPGDFEQIEASAEAPGADGAKEDKPVDKGKRAEAASPDKDKKAEAHAEEPSPVEKLVGKPAPDFTLTV
ncbi:MAG TPA: hypothetical protein VGY53_06965, partial [Isosphaeraceae bacterium]|nr:hypothetical protein [Isosphaeraceae bacterium]